MTLHAYKDSSWENNTSLDTFVSSIDQKIEEIKDKRDLQDIRPHKDIFLEQYTTCVSFLSEFFSFTKNPGWGEDGIGTCGISESHSESEILGPFMNEVLKLRALKRPKKWNTHRACSFHREKIGCILGGLKSPLCVTHVDSDVPDIYDEGAFRKFLYTIQLAGGTFESYYENTNPQKNWPVVIAFLQEVKKNSLALKTQ